MDKIGVVITVYNFEHCIAKCLNSIINQKYQNLQIVIVNDGSTDNSGFICDEIARTDKRITVIHQDNSGPIIARLKGVDILETPYISFVDGDDWLDINLYQDIVQSGYLGKADVIEYGIIRWHSLMEKKEEPCKIPKGIYDREYLEKNVIPQMLWDLKKNQYGVDPSLCTKIFKRNAILKQLEKIKELGIHFGEDIAVIYPLLLYADSLAVLEKCYYYHRIRKNHIIPSYISDTLYLKKLFDLYSYLQKEFLGSSYREEMIKQLDYFYINAVMLIKTKYGDLASEGDYMFPFEKVPLNAKIILYGAGRVGQTFYKQVERTNYCDVVGWVDRDADIYENPKVIKPEEVKNIVFDKIVVAIESGETSKIVKGYLESMGVVENKIILL